jgi:hypothetical protein
MLHCESHYERHFVMHKLSAEASGQVADDKFSNFVQILFPWKL